MGCCWFARLRTACPNARSHVGAGADPEHSLGLDRIVSAVAPWVAPEQAPSRENKAPKYAVPPDRFRRIPRAGRLVLAAPRQCGRHEALIDDDRRGDDRAHDPR